VKLGFVTPRFGPGVLGGSEAVSREMAFGLAGRGHDAEVLTTCALDHYTWANEIPEGVTEQDGIAVRRFAITRHPSTAALKAQLAIQAGQLPDLDHQVSWLGFQFGVPGLFEYLARHGHRYDAIVFSPYLFWSTSVCVPMVAERAVVVPCLHDELYARLDILRPVFEAPALMWFLSGPEHLLAHRLGPLARRHSVTGAGVPVPTGYDPEGFKRGHNLGRPFLLYAGRREEGKGTAWLLEAFGQAVLEGGADIDLVLIGKGELGRARADMPKELSSRVHDLGYVPEAERNDAFAAALAYVQPSTMESFSRTVMEAWLARTPVLANGASEVVAWHCRRSGGGATFGDGTELAQRLTDLAREPTLATGMADAGRRYVLENYTWPVVLDRMEASLAVAL
jgi:glycosyltransferase involved in cell wall biosynthesis